MTQDDRTTWRGSNPHSPSVTVCEHMLPKLAVWADAVGQAILLKALPGCGSYQTTTTASAKTHQFGGAIDIDARPLTDAQRVRVETEGRRANLLVWRRRRVPDLWTWHSHALDPSCPSLSAQAKAQFELFRDGKDGLAHGNPDEGDRAFAATILREFDRVQTHPAGVGVVGMAGAPNFDFPYGPGFPVPGEAGSMYGRSTAGQPLYSGTVALNPTVFKNTGPRASGFLTLAWIQGHIKRVQRALGAFVDGKYQQQTFDAVTAFQVAHHLTVDGKVGGETWLALARSKGQ